MQLFAVALISRSTKTNLSNIEYLWATIINPDNTGEEEWYSQTAEGAPFVGSGNDPDFGV